MFENSAKTDINNLGEFGLIDHLVQHFPIKQKESLMGPGDDAGILDPGDKKVLISTDQLIEGVHFDLSFHPLRHLGYKAVVVGISDIIACGGTAKQIYFNLAFSSRFPLDAIEELYAGVKIACDKYKVDLAGGDIASSRSGLSISVTAIGLAKEDEIISRKGAQEGDIICVTGDLGSAYMGLLLLEREKKVFLENPKMQPDLEGKDYIIGRQLKPDAKIEVLKKIKATKAKITSMIDVSDGLASDVKHLCKSSELGAVIFETKLPIDQLTWDQATEFNMEPTMAAMNGGEDYELLFTVSKEDYEKIQKVEEVSIIGYMTPKHEGVMLMTKNDNKFEIRAQGWK